MTSKPIPLSVRKRLRQRHVSEVVVMDTLGRRRNRQQAAPIKDEEQGWFWLLVVLAVAAAPVIWFAMFTFFLFVTPGPVR